MDKELLEMRIARFEGEPPFAKRTYGKACVCKIWGGVQIHLLGATKTSCKRKRQGRPPLIPNDRLVEEIKAMLRHTESLGIRTSKERVRKLMQKHGLQAPHRTGRLKGPKVHDETIIPMAPNIMWDTDATQVYTRIDGTITIFVAVVHFVSDVVGIHAAVKATRHEALEPIYQGIREQFGALDKDVAKGLILRHDHGSQYMSHHFQDDIKDMVISHRKSTSSVSSDGEGA